MPTTAISDPSVAALLERLAELAPAAAANRGPLPPDDPRRVAAAEFTRTLAEAYRRCGVSPAGLAATTGLPWRTLKSRLQRHSYLSAPPSMRAHTGQIADRPTQQQCLRGHDFTDENTYSYRDSAGRTHRVCRRCRAQRQANKRAGQATAGPDSTKAAPDRGNRLRRDLQTLSAVRVSSAARRSDGPPP